MERDSVLCSRSVEPSHTFYSVLHQPAVPALNNIAEVVIIFSEAFTILHHDIYISFQ